MIAQPLLSGSAQTKGPPKRPFPVRSFRVRSVSEKPGSALWFATHSIGQQRDCEVNEDRKANTEQDGGDKSDAPNQRVYARPVCKAGAYAEQLAIVLIEAKTGLRGAAIVLGQIAHARTPTVEIATLGAAGTAAVAMITTVMISAPAAAIARAATVLDSSKNEYMGSLSCL